MAFSRVAAIRSTLRGTRPTSFSRPQLWRQAARRGYASGGHAKKGGDALWAAGSIAVTVPTCWWLLSNGPDTSHHGGHGGEHGASHHKEKEEEPKEEESKDDEKEEESKDDKDAEKSDADGKESDKSDDSDSEDKSDTPATSDDEGDDKVSESDEGKVTKKTYPDAKGGVKKRLESNKAIKQGEDLDTEFEDKEDKPASSKPAASQNKTSGKQEGLSNTDTKHSEDIQNQPEKSKKAEGAPESAKLKGSVDPKRPIK